MIICQFLHQEHVGISYLFGCDGRASGAVVDPVGEIESPTLGRRGRWYAHPFDFPATRMQVKFDVPHIAALVRARRRF